jgi:hypothetical protein
MTAPEPKPVLSKLDVAKRQLDTAIWLWFNGGDIVSINLLAGSAFGVIEDLFRNRRRERPQPFRQPPNGMTEKQWINYLKAAENFSKHARKDPDGVHEFSPGDTMKYMYFACIALVSLIPGDYDAHGLRFLFVLYCGLRSKAGGALMYLSGERPDMDELKKLSRSELFEKFGGKFKGRPPLGSDYNPA